MLIILDSKLALIRIPKPRIEGQDNMGREVH